MRCSVYKCSYLLTLLLTYLYANKLPTLNIVYQSWAEISKLSLFFGHHATWHRPTRLPSASVLSSAESRFDRTHWLNCNWPTGLLPLQLLTWFNKFFVPKLLPSHSNTSLQRTKSVPRSYTSRKREKNVSMRWISQNHYTAAETRPASLAVFVSIYTQRSWWYLPESYWRTDYREKRGICCHILLANLVLRQALTL